MEFTQEPSYFYQMDQTKQKRNEYRTVNIQQERISKRNPIGYIISEITRLVTEDIEVQRQINTEIESTGSTVVPLFTTDTYPALFSTDFYKECDYRERWQFLSDIKEQSKDFPVKTITVTHGPFAGWKITCGRCKRNAGDGNHVHGGTWYAYTIDLYFPNFCTIL